MNLSPAWRQLFTTIAKLSTTGVRGADLRAVRSPMPHPEASIFARKELFGAAEVFVTEEEVDVIAVSRAIAKRREGSDAAFMLYNLDALYDRFQLWTRELPHVEPFYAVKCNTDETLLRMLATLGTGFDCASREEIDTIMRLGVAAERIIYAHPQKPRSYVVHASAVGVDKMTFDSEEEMDKIAAHHKRPQLILRISTSDATAKNQLSMKFGADIKREAPKLLIRAADMGLPVVGVSFHVGNGCNDPSAYRLAIKHSRTLFDIGHSLGHRMELLDVGGGYPGDDYHPTSFEKIAAVIRSALDEFFPQPDVRFVAEPGRFFAMRPGSVVASVLARKRVPANRITKNSDDATASGFMYYLNDGVFGSFSNNISYGDRPIGRPLFDEEGALYPSMIWGPTCDCIDKIEDHKMMRALDVGDSLIYEDMGAYSNVLSTAFNGFPRANPINVIGQRTWKALGL